MRNNLYSVIAIAIVFKKYCSEYLILVRSPTAGLLLSETLRERPSPIATLYLK
ncbi:hypothetical protein [Nostoc sp. 'Peltigera membranacea cyanobiont' 210A]|uniref:hypothetical protein n=1 Tax=Nostoc sp. 'Peltigera membranacea cyanobiont' 210A TaxID=2014529 RepID=UPI00167CF168|nr:hypothetical protein [Nostoc sp. 'Peltigera membranacea cyanobiont' 210A]